MDMVDVCVCVCEEDGRRVPSPAAAADADMVVCNSAAGLSPVSSAGVSFQLPPPPRLTDDTSPASAAAGRQRRVVLPHSVSDTAGAGIGHLLANSPPLPGPGSSYRGSTSLARLQPVDMPHVDDRRHRGGAVTTQPAVCTDAAAAHTRSPSHPQLLALLTQHAQQALCICRAFGCEGKWVKEQLTDICIYAVHESNLCHPISHCLLLFVYIYYSRAILMYSTI